MGGRPSVLLAQFLLPSFGCSVPAQFLPFLMDAAAFQFAQLRIAAHASHKLIGHLKEGPAQQQDKKDNGGIQQWRKGMRLKGDMELNRDTQGNDIDQRSLRDHRKGKSADADDADRKSTRLNSSH